MEAKIKEFIEAKYPALIPLIKIEHVHFMDINANVCVLGREFTLNKDIDKHPTFTHYLDEILHIIQKCPTLAPLIGVVTIKNVKGYPSLITLERGSYYFISGLDSLKAFDEVIANVIRMKKEALQPLPIPIANEISQHIF